MNWTDTIACIIFYSLILLILIVIGRSIYTSSYKVRYRAPKRIIKNVRGQFSPEVRIGVFGGWRPIKNKEVLCVLDERDRWWYDEREEAIKAANVFHDYYKQQVDKRSISDREILDLDVEFDNLEHVEQIMAECRVILERNGKQHVAR